MRAKVALLHDVAAATGRPDESDTVREAAAIAAALAELGYEPLIVPVGLDLRALERTLATSAPKLVFNLVESLEGRGELVGVVPALLEALGVPYTGCGAQALGASSHKLLAKRLLARAGIATPAVFSGAPDDEGPWIVKSVFEHASLGIDDSSVVAAAAVPALLADRAAQFGGRWFAERYVPGRELNVALIATPQGVRALPVAEIRFAGFPPGKPAIVGYAAKWDTESFEYRNTVRSFAVERTLAEQVTEMALACWDLFALDGHARVDFRVPQTGAPAVLEINANPCLAPDAGFAAALTEAGLPYGTAIDWLVADALRRTRGSQRGGM